MTVIRLEGDKKEIYIKNLLTSTRFLIKVLKVDQSLNRSDWDKLVYEEIGNKLNLIEELFYFLQRRTKDLDPINNFGIYSDLVISNGGLPEIFAYHQLIEDQKKADEKIKSVLETEGISSKEELAKKWIDIVNNSLEIREHTKSYLDTLPDKYQLIEFYEKLRSVSLFDISKPMDKLTIKLINDKKHDDKLTVKLIGNEKDRKIYIISWFNYVLGNGVWNIYVAKICEKRKLSIINRRDNKIIGDNIDENFKKFLEDHINSGAFFLARDIDKNFNTIYPEKITMFQFGPNFVEGIKFGKYLDLIRNDDYFLTAQREDIENGGINIFSNINSKYVWDANKITEEKFGICSKDLEKHLREIIKIHKMRFYVI